MKTRMDRVPLGLSQIVEKEAQKKGVPKTFIYREIESAISTANKIEEMLKTRKRNEKPLFRF